MGACYRAPKLFIGLKKASPKQRILFKSSFRGGRNGNKRFSMHIFVTLENLLFVPEPLMLSNNELS